MENLGFSLNQINKDIKKEYKSIRNRIQSILLDNKFLTENVVPQFPDFPLVPNERCGLWYCSPSNYETTSYFKSTDGHINMWDFSTRRLNFHLLPAIADKGGIVIVDSTRRGKTMPDALSKTVPIWCAVLNTLMLESQVEKIDRQVLFLPPGTLSDSECDRIAERIPQLVEKLKRLDILDGRMLYEQLRGRILRPFWVFPGSSVMQANRDLFTGEVVQEKWQTPEDELIVPVILCTVSYKAQDGTDKRHGFTYVQGAADDHELWSSGLTPQMFWSHLSYLGDPSKSDENLHSFVNELLSHELNMANVSKLSEAFPCIDPITTEISLGKVVDRIEINSQLLKNLKMNYSYVILMSKGVTVSAPHEQTKDFFKMYQLQSGCKISSKALRTQLLDIYPQLGSRLNGANINKKPILICCNSGTDLSIGVILVLLCKNYLADWRLGMPTDVSKIIIRRHLTKLITHLNGRNVNPSRATLNSVNSFLM